MTNENDNQINDSTKILDSEIKRGITATTKNCITFFLILLSSIIVSIVNEILTLFIPMSVTLIILIIVFNVVYLMMMIIVISFAISWNHGQLQQKSEASQINHIPYQSSLCLEINSIKKQLEMLQTKIDGLKK